MFFKGQKTCPGRIWIRPNPWLNGLQNPDSDPQIRITSPRIRTRKKYLLVMQHCCKD